MGVTESTLRLFHSLTDSVKIVAGRDHREKQNDGAAERADNHE